MDVFDFEEYRPYLQALIEANKHIRGFKGSLAKAAACHASHFSQAMNGTVHLTLEQASGITVFCEMGELEAGYFVMLVLKERSGTPTLRKMAAARLAELKERRFSISGRTQEIKKLGDAHSFYFSSYLWSVIFALTRIEAYQTCSAIAEKLQIRDSVAQRYLDHLVDEGLLKESMNKAGEVCFSHTSGHLALKEDSLFLPSFHSSMRQLATQKIMKHDYEGELCYSYVHAMSRDDALKMKQFLTQSLKQVHKVVADSKEEEVYMLLCDFMPV